ncbi:uncharacterized protein F5891DRAFT_513508 [Suillus fuscotomentosus]|uniref:Uncharacterized protein n=1 Tax=Suillus fuscotomentosus TaxID=1912939 RepID=A0AAD4HIC0_9AGAM|nr:uncharacterized protein F5891DRAFT_513508 [Suillus fuscotomentosus]KAG1897658.1 hypothetical protein F5891DRAFT_513508 [Suillus fuscotomentosus]
MRVIEKARSLLISAIPPVLFMCHTDQIKLDTFSVERKGSFIRNLHSNRVDDYPEGSVVICECPGNYMQARDSLVHLGLWIQQMSQGGFIRSVAYLAATCADSGSAQFSTPDPPSYLELMHMSHLHGRRSGEEGHAFERFWTISALSQDTNYASSSTHQSIHSHTILNLPQNPKNSIMGSALDKAAPEF